LGSVFSALGAFDLDGDGTSAAIRLRLAPGAYTGHFSGADGGTGVGIIEVYDAATGEPASMVNLSTRGVAGTVVRIITY